MLPKAGKKKAASESTESISLPANLNAADIDRIMAGPAKDLTIRSGEGGRSRKILD